MSEEQIQIIVDKALRAYHESVRRRNQWFLGILLTILVSCLSGVVVLIQNDTKLAIHTGDGHPETVKKMVQMQEDRVHAQGLQLTRIEVNQGHLQDGQERINECIDDLKKKLSDR